MNPPFHDAGADNPGLGRAFIRAAAGMLRPGGVCLLTANRHLPYEAEMKSLFAEVPAARPGRGLQDLRGAQMTKLPEQMRLDRLLANMGYGSRRDIQQWVKAKAIVLDGAPVADADSRIAVTADLSHRLTVLGKPLDPPPGMIVMLNKPLGVTCSHKEAGPLVYDLLPDRWRTRKPAISTVGRLDKDTSGLLLLTDDGDLLHRLISPRTHSPKRYVASLARPLRGDEGGDFRRRHADARRRGEAVAAGDARSAAPQLAVLTLTEGRYHQVRRMFAAVGNHVEALHRDRIGDLDLPDDLGSGAWRLLTTEEIAKLGL